MKSGGPGLESQDRCSLACVTAARQLSELVFSSSTGTVMPSTSRDCREGQRSVLKTRRWEAPVTIYSCCPFTPTGSAGTERVWLGHVAFGGVEPWPGASPSLASPVSCRAETPGPATASQHPLVTGQWRLLSSSTSVAGARAWQAPGSQLPGASGQGSLLSTSLAPAAPAQELVWHLDFRQKSQPCCPPSDSWAWRGARVDNGGPSKCPTSRGVVWSNSL